jgi:hypothetical protein
MTMDPTIYKKIVTKKVLQFIPTSSPIYKKNINNGFFSIYRIYEILSNAQVPFYVHDKIIETIGYEIVAKDFDPFAPEFKRKTFIKQLFNNFTTPKPQVYTVHLESYENTENHDTPHLHRDSVEVVCFDFIEQLKDLLSDLELFGNTDNLVVNNNPNKPEEKWLPYVNKKTIVYEVLDGKWYQEYAIPLIQDSEKEFIIPIGFYIDASETVTYQRYSFQPLLMFPLILNLKSRSKPTSSRIIALIPDLEAKSSAVKIASKMTRRKSDQCLEVALQSFKTAQMKGVNCFVLFSIENA